MSDVTRGKYDDYVRLNGQVVPIQVVQISPEEGGIVREKVVEEGTRVKKGDVILRLSNSNLDLQILNAEAELAEKQNLLRNTQVAMQQDRLNNRTEQATLDTDCDRKRRAYEQNARLYKERLISKEVYLQSREDYNLALRKQSLISQRLKQDSIYRHVQMAQMEDNLDNMRKNVLLVRDRKNKLEVRSAIDGELGLLDVELGQNIAAGQNIGQINDLSDELEDLEADLYEEEDEDGESEDAEDEDSDGDDDDDAKDDDIASEPFYEVACPNCGETVYVSEDDLDAGEANCAHCGVTFEVALEDDDEEQEEGPVQYEVTCPACGQTTVFEEDDLLDGAPKCPGCGKPLDFEVTEE